MVAYTVRRLLLTLPVLWAALTLTFVLVRAAPGDPVEIMFGPQAEGGASVEAVSREQKDARRRELGLDRPLPEQYASWLGRVLRGDLGTSFKSRRPVAAELRQRLPATAALAVAAFAVELVLVLGLGLWAAAQAGRFVDHGIRILALALIVAGLYGPGLMKILLASAAVWWVGYARITRSMVLQAKQEGHVLAARAAGARPWQIALSEVLPLVLGPMVVLATLSMGRLLLAISALSFLGLGAQPPTAEWGLMLSEGKAYFLEAPHLMVFPGLMIFVTVLGLNLLGEGLRDVLDPAGVTGRS